MLNIYVQLCSVMFKPIFLHKVGFFLYRFSRSILFSGTYGYLTLPFFTLPSVFGHGIKKSLIPLLRGIKLLEIDHKLNYFSKKQTFPLRM
jgi:hypothetical protein